MFLVRQIGRSWCVIMMTLGALGLGALLFSPERMTPWSTVLSVILLLGGAALFVLLDRKAEDED